MADTPNPPRENLVRALSEPPELVRDADTPPLLRGHFAVWDTWTEINSAYEGRFMERFAPSSMDKTLSEGRDQMRVLFQHGRDPQIGDKPIGKILSLEADATGARYVVEPFMDASYVRDLMPGLQAGVYGASHRFQVVQEQFDKKPPKSDHNPLGLPERTVTEARVREFGPVTWGAYPTATAAVRSMTDEFIVGRFAEDPERLLELIRTAMRTEPVVSVAITQAIPASDDVEQDAAVPADRAVEPEPSEATTPQPQETPEPEPSEATTRSSRDLFWFANNPSNKGAK